MLFLGKYSISIQDLVFLFFIFYFFRFHTIAEEYELLHYFIAISWFHTIAEEYELLHYFITISSFMNYEMCIQLGVTKLIVHLLIGFTSFEKVKGYFKQQEGEDVS